MSLKTPNKSKKIGEGVLRRVLSVAKALFVKRKCSIAKSPLTVYAVLLFA